MASVSSILAAPDSKTDAVHDGRGRNQTPAGLSLFKQPVLGFRYDDLVSDIKTAHAERCVAQNRPGMASIALLAHHFRLISTSDIDAYINKGAAGVYALYRSSMSRLQCHFDSVSMSVARERKGEINWHFTPISISMIGGEKGFFVKIQSDMHFTELSLNTVEADIANLVYGCLVFIVRELGFGLLPEDLLSVMPMLDEDLHFYQKEIQHSSLSLEEMAKSMIENEDEHFSYYYSDAESLADRLAFLDLLIRQPVQSLVCSMLTMQQVADALVKIKRNERDRFKNPWLGFVRKTVMVWKQRIRQSNGEDDTSFSLDDADDGDAPLDYGHAFGIGLGWEAELANDLFQAMYEAGEAPNAYLQLTTDTVPGVAKKLMALAQARGLIRYAEFVNFQCEKTK